MTPSEFEEYVSRLVNQLDCFKNAVVLRNHRFDGVRQPGEYEIDVAVKVRLSDTIDFFLIIECKNWGRPVDRPVIQKLAQTRDALGAHKAAVASPLGFTKEAIEVADVHGIALWVISESDWSIMMGWSGPGREVYERYVERLNYLKGIGFTVKDETRRARGLSIVEFSHVARGKSKDVPWVQFNHHCSGGSAVPPGSGESGVDPRLATTMLVDECARLLGQEPVQYHG